MTRLKLFLVAVAVALGFWGCDSIWLPDSSGILFIRNESHSLVHYDLATKAEKVVARYDWLTTDMLKSLPAIKPDGKQVALVRHAATPGGVRAQVFIHDLSGKQVHASEEFDVARSHQGKPKPWQGAGRAHWSHDGRRIVFFLITDCADKPGKGADAWFQDTNDYVAGVYDVQTKKTQFHVGFMEVEEFGLVGLSPVVPGERGFVATESSRPDKDASKPADDDPAEGLVRIDWEGKRHPFRATPRAKEEAKRAKEESQKQAERGQPGGPAEATGGIVGDGAWKGPVATVRDEDGSVVTLDCEKMVLDLAPPDKSDPVLKYAESAKVQVYPLGESLLLQFRDKFAPQADPDKPGPQHVPAEVELVRRVREDGQWKWTTRHVASIGAIDWFVPAPDKKHALVLWSEGEGEKSHVMVISREGKVVADLKRANPMPQEKPEDGRSAPPPAPAPAPPPKA